MYCMGLTQMTIQSMQFHHGMVHLLTLSVSYFLCHMSLNMCSKIPKNSMCSQLKIVMSNLGYKDLT